MQAADARAREAALLLHGLVPPQREAVLARLAPAHVDALRPLLAELTALGIPASLAQAQSSAHAGAGAHAALPACAVGAPALPEPQCAGRALGACAVPTVVALLRGAPLAWRTAVLAGLPRDRRRDVVEQLEGATALPPRVTEALHRRLREEASRAVGAGRSATRPGRAGWKRWLLWIR